MSGCASRYQNCLQSRCCVDASDACFKRPTREYAQCRPLATTECGDENWLCPCWSSGCLPPSPPSRPSPPPPPFRPTSIAVLWSDNSSEPFSEPFVLSASNSSIWIEPLRCDADNGGCAAQPFMIRGTSWSGAQEHGCVHELWRYSVAEYLAFLERNAFNAVRLPLSASLVSSNAALPATCGEYAGRLTLDALDDLILRLQRIGVLVLLDMHTLGEGGSASNTPFWCGEDAPCDEASERPLMAAWGLLAARYCSRPNVMGADLFNEPYGATWPSTDLPRPSVDLPRPPPSTFHGRSSTDLPPAFP